MTKGRSTCPSSASFIMDETHESPSHHYTRYLEQLEHLERLLYRHRRYWLLSATLFVACAGMGIYAFLEGDKTLSPFLAALGMMLSINLSLVSNARPSCNHLKIVLLVERISPPGPALPLPARETVQLLSHTRAFMGRLDEWIDSERQRVMILQHHQTLSVRYA